MIKWLINKFTAPIAAQEHRQSSSITPVVHAVPPSIPVYPPVDTGIQVASASEILNSQKELMGRLRILAGGTDEYYEKYFLKVVFQLAEYIQLLPASSGVTHVGAGGLFRLCLEVGFFSLQSSERVVFAGQVTVELRRELEPRWRYATFLAGLCSELHRIISEMAITDKNGNAWPKYLQSLTEWTKSENLDRYYVQWHKPQQLHTLSTGRSDVAVIIMAILPSYALQYLEDFSSAILPVVFAVASNSSHASDSPVAKIVSETRVKILKRDDATRKEKYGQLTVGNHLEPYLLDAMRQLIRSEVWKINQPKSRLWLSEDGLFLIWKSGAKEILTEVISAGVSGAPNNIVTLAEILCDSKIAERNGKDLFWMIIPGDAIEAYQAIKFVNPLSILEDLDMPLAVVRMKSDANTQLPINKNEPVTKSKVDLETGEILSVKVKTKKPSIDAQRDLLGMEDAGQDPEPEKVIAKIITDSETEAKDMVAITPSTRDVEQAISPVAGTNNQPNKVVTSETVPSQANSNKKSTSQIPEPSTRKSKEKDDEAEILPAKKQSSYTTYVSEKARPLLKPEVCEVIGKMIDDYRKGRYKQSILNVSQGIAFELQQIQKYGLSNDKLVGLLHSNDWLETPEANKNAKFMKIQNLEGKTTSAIVIKHSAALFLGFIDES